jgi:hypothetical protein
LSQDGRDVYRSNVDPILSNVYWIGGSPCAGKSTVADALAAFSGLPIYRCDDAYERHRDLIDPEGYPVFYRLSRASCDDLWMRPVAQQVAESLALYREEFPLILADLVELAGSGPVLAEGAALLPELLDQISVAAYRCAWIVPTEEFQRAHYTRRPWRHDVLKDCADKETAWQNWMAHDAGFARAIAADAESRRCRLLVVDGTQPVAETVRSVAEWFRFQ